ncbi:tyrosine-type recombinase/integrase [Micromonospora terminaliae]|uniref:Tyrosine-type recombinase/integrase n=2 Tax=Micromonospora terminaliae TaxID=1914461 RepID=A0ABX6EAK4_9ACTN|nr:tyrosine-type recombinase/integrase [Micromonospora terminaliae]
MKQEDRMSVGALVLVSCCPRWELRGTRTISTGPGTRSGLRLASTGFVCMTCGTFLLVSGASPRTVMKVLGHSQIGLTVNTYAHVLPDIERAAVDEAAKHFFG